jgi:HSP20 family protein
MPNPFEGVTDFFSEMSRMREVGLRGHDQSHEGHMRTYATAWVPATDIFARAGDLVIRVDLAGVHPEDVEITLSQGTLTVAGQRLTELGPASADDFFVRERPYGAFRRSISLPATTKDDDISAEFVDGVTEITVAGGATAPETRRIKLRKRPREPTRRSPA